jgi:hypothetical protein
MKMVLTTMVAHKYFRLLIPVLLFGVLTGAVLGLSRRAKRRPQGPQSLPVSLTSKTPTVRVLDSHVVPIGSSSLLTVKLQNVSTKDIKAITLSAGNKWIVQSFVLSDDSLRPGSDTGVSLELTFGSPGDNDVTAQPYTIAAVLFADGTGDGDVRHVKMLCDNYAGMRAQAARVLQQLGRLSTNTIEDPALTDLENRARALPTSEESASQDYQDGLREARSWLLRQLDEIKDRKKSNLLDAADKKQEKVKRVFQSLTHGSAN